MVKPIKRSDNPIPPGVDIGHVHMKAADLDKIYNFYVGVLGFDVITRLPDALFLSSGGYHHHLGFNTWESKGGTAPPPGTTGLYHIAIRYPKRRDLGDALRRLVRAGYPLEGANDHGTHIAIYLHDPESNGLELYWDRPESEWPVDEKGRLKLVSSMPDLDSLLKEG
jgi:catechol 2,3-dioxygenase